MKPKVLIITMFQHGEPGTADSVGEASAWIEHYALNNQINIPGIRNGVYTNDQNEIALIITGVGKANASTTMMCVGMHPSIDLSEAYIIVCGIAGANPEEVSVGSPVWCDAVVDGDLASFVSLAELDRTRSFPFFPMGTTGLEEEEKYTSGTEVYFMDEELVHHAYELTRDVPLVDDLQSKAYRTAYEVEPATLPPFVAKGGFLSSDTFLHGHITGQWSTEWMKGWSENRSRYMLGNQEDSGTLTALRALHEMGKVQWRRIVLLRAGSNYDRPAPGVSALDSLKNAISDGVPVSMDIALENIFRVADRFVASVVR